MNDEFKLFEQEIPDQTIERSSKGISADVIYNLLYQRFKKNDGEYVVAGEVYNDLNMRASRRYDFIAVNCWSSQTIEVVEIKISQSDLRHEVEHPEKHNVIFDNIDYYSLAAPDDVLYAQKEIIPKHWGIYAVKRDKEGKWFLKKMRSPMALHDERSKEIKRGFAFSLIRALDKQSALRHTLKSQLLSEYNRGYKDAEEKCASNSNYYIQVRRDTFERYETAYQFLRELGMYNFSGYERTLFKRKLQFAISSGREVHGVIDHLNGLINVAKASIERIEKAKGQYEIEITKEEVECDKKFGDDKSEQTEI